MWDCECTNDKVREGCGWERLYKGYHTVYYLVCVCACVHFRVKGWM